MKLSGSWSEILYDEEFKIHTNDSAFQLVAVVSQKFKPIAFYSIRITDAQKRYKVIGKELLITVETLKGFKNILIGQILIIYTDHKTLHVRILILIEY